jgi:hypothetical protein
MSRRDLGVNALCLAGALLVAGGLGLVYLPAGVVAFGAFLLVAAWLMAVQR